MAAKDESTFPLHLDRYHLPQPEWTFPNAKINLYAQDSEPDFPPVRQAPAEPSLWASADWSSASGRPP
mgnify:CR=1 FL=1